MASLETEAGAFELSGHAKATRRREKKEAAAADWLLKRGGGTSKNGKSWESQWNKITEMRSGRQGARGSLICQWGGLVRNAEA